MPLRTIRNRSLADQVFEQLSTEILNGHYAAETTLPAERALSQLFGVNRHVVREALRRLEQIGVLKVSQGGATKVLDFTRHAGLDLLALMAEHAHAGQDTARYWQATFEMRAAIGPDIARLCALRASPELRAELCEIAKSMSAEPDVRTLFTLEVRFWDRMLDGANNIAYRLAFNSLMKGVYAIAEIVQHWSAAELQSCGYRVSLAAAIAEGDAARAEAETRTSMRSAVKIMLEYTEASWASATPNESLIAEKPRRVTRETRAATSSKAKRPRAPR